MKRLIPLGLVTAIILSVAVIVPPTTANGQGAGLVSSVLNRLEKNRESLKSLRAGISMQKYNSQLRVNEDFYGSVMYLPGSGRNGSVKLEWTKPQHEIIAVAGGKYKILRPRLKTVIEGSATKAPGGATGVLDMMYMSRQQLETKFQPVRDVREETLWGNVSTIHLTLVPKGKASYKYAEVWIDNAGMPVQTKIVEQNDDATTMRLTAVEKNVKLSSGDFDLKIGSDIKVIKS
jgi:outer membrane lipoprotein-sorting protein